MQVTFSNGRYRLPEYPFQPPPELAGAQRRHPVVIIGAGLAGLTAACALAQLDVPVVLVDEDNTVGVRGLSSRGVCYARKSLEIFDRLGIYRRMAVKGVRWTIGRTFDDDEQIHEFDLAAVASASRQPPFINLQQFYVEAFLIERAVELGVDLRWRSKVRRCEHDASGVALTVETPAGPYSLLADWVIDCSGARGALAESLGIRRHGTQADDRWCIADVIFDRPMPVERHTWVSAGFNEGRAVWRHALADQVWRLDYQLDPDSGTANAGEQAIRERLHRQLGQDIGYRIVWMGSWSYRSECLERFRCGRVLFAGDCAHTMSPFGGRGGNSSIQDADNLAWKLAWVIAGKADASLLDTYADERRAAALENIRTAARSGRFLRPANPAEEVYRDATLALARHHPFARSLVNTGRMSQPNVYADSRLNVGPGGGRSVPNLPLALPDGRDGDLSQLMKWACGDLVALVGTESAELTALEARFPIRFVADARVGGVSARLAESCDAPAGQVLLIRPDLYCAGTFEQGDVAVLEPALRTLTCHTTTGTNYS